ncbi:MAG: DUF4240 domain-containing protein [Planctomycetota bacterium]
MDKQLFWKLVADARETGGTNDEACCDALTDALAEMEGPEIITFDRIWREEVDDAYFWDLWIGAALLLNGADAELFTNFRHWLVGQGEEIYKASVTEPDSMTAFAGKMGDQNLTLMFDAAADAYMDVTGNTIPDPTLPPPIEPLGEEWDGSDEQAKARLPKLFQATRG